jgi:hypothetical protein
LIKKIKELLIKHPELIKEQYRDKNRPLFGHCYTASEVYYHLKGKIDGYIPYCMEIEEGTHWFLKNLKTNDIIDLTCGKIQYDYSNSRPVPFMTKEPSKRAKIILREMNKQGMKE